MPHSIGPAPAIYYETSGAADGAPLVLIEGMGAQLIGWRDGFVDRLVAGGMFVIRLDNRDVGLSDKLGEPGSVGLAYTLDDMAGDVCRVLDALGLASAHIVGQSLGGGVAQAMAITAPARVRSMTLFYTAPAFSDAFVTDEIKQRIGTPPPSAPRSRDAEVATFVEHQRLCGSTAFPFDEAWMRELGARTYDRCFCPDGAARQAMAAVASPDRSEQLRRISVPTAIIHGRADRLIKVEAGLALAELINDTELHIYPGMGHQVVEPLWGDFISIIARTVGRHCDGDQVA